MVRPSDALTKHHQGAAIGDDELLAAIAFLESVLPEFEAIGDRVRSMPEYAVAAKAVRADLGQLRGVLAAREMAVI